tara:strand:- start:1264 stop:3000 length:1737 start_codon:yes stop_codon:yes gene_type:complete
MEYLANRMGLIFMKINGPALGHEVTSLDPEEAPNAGAREEVKKLNLALEMGDNVMIYVDDIQHCHPEFLQKFISLCDAQRKIEGVWRGQPKTYDMRGRRVVVVMAGNPYTESGEKFRIPDMLANRADTYNLGDDMKGREVAFSGSYIENAVTSNPVLQPLAKAAQKDIQAFIRMAETDQREGIELQGNFSANEQEELINVIKKLITLRDVVLKVNQLYIESAGQADEFRTEPAFKMQGSYRNMNRLAEKILPMMNEQELMDLVLDHYKGESQTLTTGAEANFLKFKQLIGVMTDEEAERWEEIKRTFGRNQYLQGGDQNDPVSRVVSQLSLFSGGLENIQDTLKEELSKPRSTNVELGGMSESIDSLRETVSEHLKQQAEVSRENPELSGVNENLTALRASLENYLTRESQGAAPSEAGETPAKLAAPQFSSINENLGALRSAVETYLSRSEESAQSTAGDETAQYLQTLAAHMNEGLVAIRTDMAEAMKQMQSSQISQQVSAMRDSIVGLRDVLAQNRERLRQVQGRLKEAEPEVVMEFSEEMIDNNEALLRAISQQIEQLREEGEGDSPGKPESSQ